MFLKKLVNIAVAVSIFFSTTAHAYDLPKIVTDKKKPKTTTEEPAKKTDDNDKSWEGAKLFEQKLKVLLAENENLPASSKERINRDKNLVFVAFYKGNAYFLDRFSIKVAKNNHKKQCWKQRIFPIGQKILPRNAAATLQNFCLQDGEFYNSLSKRYKIFAAENDEDKKFLAECFRVGYYYAFKKEIEVK